MKRLSGARLEVLTFERGVDDFTLSCGTGVLAAGYWYQKKYGVIKRIRVQAPGGKFIIESQENSYLLTGEAHISFVGKFSGVHL